MFIFAGTGTALGRGQCDGAGHAPRALSFTSHRTKSLAIRIMIMSSMVLCEKNCVLDIASSLGWLFSSSRGTRLGGKGDKG
jgi:hypothetical protein